MCAPLALGRAGFFRRLLIAFFFILGALPLHAGPVYELLAGFELGPQRPQGGRLILEPDGSLYGVSSQGGESNAGTIYQIKANGTVNVLGHLARLGARAPLGSLVADGFGQFWGTTSFSGVNNYSPGIIFKYNVATGALTRVAQFGNVGGSVQYGLARDGSGFLWGTRYAGGSQFLGSVFKVKIETGAVTPLLDFTGTSGASPGSYPTGELIHDGLGYLWGAAFSGGSLNCGTIFKIHIASGVLSTVAEFTNDPLAPNRGIGPRGPLLRDANGSFGGGTDAGGSAGLGVIFKVNIATGVLTTVAGFSGNGAGPQRGGHPQGGFALDAAGNAWGVTSGGGLYNAGAIFKVNLATGQLTAVADLHSSVGPLRGGAATGGLTSDGQGRIWGTTTFTDPAQSHGGYYDYRGTGTVFRLDPIAETAATIIDWQHGVPGRAGTTPSAVVDDGQGQLWTTLLAGGTYGAGSIVKLDRITGKTTTVRDFTGSGSIYHGVSPSGARLAADGAGNLWGAAASTGTSPSGAIFKIRISDGAYTTVAEFTGKTGSARGSGAGSLTRDGAGNFWGPTGSGGTADLGVIYKINIATGTFTNVVDFTGKVGPSLGAQPSVLARDAAGNLWGSTMSGGAADAGTVFKIDPVTNEFTTVVQFTGGTIGVARGATPLGVTWDGAGFLWGTTYNGGAYGAGIIFKVSASTGAITNMYDIRGYSGPGIGYGPGGLTLDAGGNLWGATSAGGGYGGGTIFKINRSTGVLNAILAIIPAVHGSAPGFYFSGDGNLYGASYSQGQTRTGGGADGSIFRMRFGPTPETTAATDVTANSARLNGTLNPNGHASNARFELSTDASFAASQTFDAGVIPLGAKPVAFGLTVGGLATATTYYFRARGENVESTVPQRGAIVSFTTTAAAAAAR